MFKKIMVPVDLVHMESNEKAISIAIDISNIYEASIVLVGITGEAPGPVARTPKEYTEKLQVIAAALAAKVGHGVAAHAIVSHDPAVEIDKLLAEAVTDLGADLVVVASHVPTFLSILDHAHGSRLASHTTASVFVVR